MAPIKTNNTFIIETVYSKKTLKRKVTSQTPALELKRN